MHECASPRSLVGFVRSHPFTSIPSAEHLPCSKHLLDPQLHSYNRHGSLGQAWVASQQEMKLWQPTMRFEASPNAHGFGAASKRRSETGFDSFVFSGASP